MNYWGQSKNPKDFYSDPRYLVILLISLLVVSACSTKPHVVKQTEINVPAPKEIYIVSHGWHTGFVVPVSTIQSLLPQLRDRFPDTPYMEFGWGDKSYYQAEEVTFGLTMRAVLWPTDSVVQVSAVLEKPDIQVSDGDLETLCLDSQQYSLLIDFIEQSFLKNSDGNIIKSKDDADSDSLFYKGVGDYYLMNTCNTWTAKGLNSAGLSISPAFKITAGSIMGYLSKHDKASTWHLCGTNKVITSTLEVESVH